MAHVAIPCPKTKRRGDLELRARDAESFDRYLRKRFARFNLALADEKTRLLLLGRFAAEIKAAYDERPETFNFLGFTHLCGTDRRGTIAVVRLPQLAMMQPEVLIETAQHHRELTLLVPPFPVSMPRDTRCSRSGSGCCAADSLNVSTRCDCNLKVCQIRHQRLLGLMGPDAPERDSADDSRGSARH
jgi:hypothetical protein